VWAWRRSRAPEQGEKVDKEDDCPLASLVGAARVDCLEGALADQGYANATDSAEV
jgi:hypothetical protein